MLRHDGMSSGVDGGSIYFGGSAGDVNGNHGLVWYPIPNLKTSFLRSTSPLRRPMLRKIYWVFDPGLRLRACSRCVPLDEKARMNDRFETRPSLASFVEGRATRKLLFEPEEKAFRYERSYPLHCQNIHACLEKPVCVEYIGEHDFK